MQITVIVATYNRSASIIQLLVSLEGQTLSDEQMEVVIVDDGSSDGTAEKITTFIESSPRHSWRFIQQIDNKGKAAACNIAILTAASSLILFTDDDCVVASDWAEMHVKCHQESKEDIGILGTVSYPIEWINRSNFVKFSNSRYVGNRKTWWNPIDLHNLPPNLFAALNTSVKRQTLIDIGLFDVNIGRGQDCELAYRLWAKGIRLHYDSRPRIIHFSPEMESITIWLNKFVKAYKSSFPEIERLHPGYINLFGHWFLEKPSKEKVITQRNIVRAIVRTICLQWLMKVVKSYLEITDKIGILYCPALFYYVITTASSGAVRTREEDGKK